MPKGRERTKDASGNAFPAQRPSLEVLRPASPAGSRGEGPNASHERQAQLSRLTGYSGSVLNNIFGTHRREVAPQAVAFVVAAVIHEHLQEPLLLARPFDERQQCRVIAQETACHVAKRVVVRLPWGGLVARQDGVTHAAIAVMLGVQQQDRQ